MAGFEGDGGVGGGSVFVGDIVVLLLELEHGEAERSSEKNVKLCMDYVGTE